MRSVILDIQIEADVSDATVSEIIGNILEHIDNENAFWQTEGMIQETERVSAVVIDE